MPLVYFFYPETAYRSLEEVDVIFYLADEAPGNPWINAVRISLHEPLWFGKRGEKRGEFEYENSAWHRMLMDVYGSSGNGSGSGNSNENRLKEKNGNGASGTSSDRKEERSSGSDTFVPNSATEKRARSESPIDPNLWRASSSDETSPNSTLITTITSPKTDTRKSLDEKLTRALSREKTNPASQQRVNAQSMGTGQAPRTMRISSDGTSPQKGVGRFSTETDPAWCTSDLAPVPLRISRPPSEIDAQESSAQNQDAAPIPFRHRSSDATQTHISASESTHALNYPDYLDQDDDNDCAPVIPRNRSQTSLGRRPSDSDKKSFKSFSRPRRPKEGLKRTESGNEMYNPYGINSEIDDIGFESNRQGGNSGSARKPTARDAGRAF